MATPVITVTVNHATLTHAAANPAVLVDGPKWDAAHTTSTTVTGLENVPNIDTTNASNLSSGTVSAARLPNPTASTLGGVRSLAATSHQWINSISTAGQPTSTQPDGLDVTYTQSGTGAVAYTVSSKIGQVFSAKDFGCDGGGTVADATNLNKAIVALIALGAGELKIPAGEYNCDGTTIIADLSAIATRFQSRIVISGSGDATIIRNATSAAPCFKYLGNTSNSEAYFELRNIRFKGAASAAAAVAGSKGVEIDVAAFFQVRGVTAEGFEYGHDCTDVEQFEFSNNQFRFNKNGGVFRGVGTITDTNSALITNNQYSNNSLTGLTVNHANAFKMVGGSIQYNGLVGGASNTGGLFLQEAGTGYGTVDFDTVAFEGNGGMGDVLSTQTTNPAVIKFNACGFARTQTFGPTVGYGTNCINTSGTNANTIYVLRGNTFRFFGGYTESVARPTIALNNTNCKISDDGTNYFQSVTEKLTYPVGQIASPVFGNVVVGGTFTGTGNAFFPTGIAGGIGAASALTVASTTSGAPSGDILNLFGSTINLNGVTNHSGNLAVNTNKFNVTASNGNTAVAGTLTASGDFTVGASKLVVTASNGNSAFVGLIFAAQGVVGGALPASSMIVASTSSGAPSGDILNLVGSTVNLNGTNIAPLTTAWTAYTPSVTALVGGPPTVTATGRFKQVGKTVDMEFDVLISALNGSSDGMVVSLPVSPGAAFRFIGCCKEVALTGLMGSVELAVSGTFVIVRTFSSGTFFAAGNRVVGALTYEVP